MFVKGKSGNPKGRPKKGESISEYLRASMGDKITIPGKDGKPATTITKAEFISSKMFQIAATGDLNAIGLMLKYIDGLPAQQVDTTISGPEGTPVSIMAQLTGRIQPTQGADA